MGADGRTGLILSVSSEFYCTLCSAVSDWSGDVGLVCGMKRGIFCSETPPPNNDVTVSP